MVGEETIIETVKGGETGLDQKFGEKGSPQGRLSLGCSSNFLGGGARLVLRK